jgi:hypothetical protein
VPVRYRNVLPIQHVGLVSDRVGPDGQPMILHNSPRYGGVVETSASEFCVGAMGRLCWHGPLPKAKPVPDVLEAARSEIGSEYDGLKNNCEHFVTRVSTGEASSPQVAANLAAGGFMSGVLGSVCGAVAVAIIRALGS